MGTILSKQSTQKKVIVDAADAATAPPGAVLVYDASNVPPQFVAADSVSGQALPEKVARVHKDSLPMSIERMIEVRMVLTEI